MSKQFYHTILHLQNGIARPLARQKTRAAATLASQLALLTEAGAVGLTIGRNVWQHSAPQRMVQALRVALADRQLDAALACLGEVPLAV